jgi:hypothetical protein
MSPSEDLSLSLFSQNDETKIETKKKDKLLRRPKDLLSIPGECRHQDDGRVLCTLVARANAATPFVDGIPVRHGQPFDEKRSSSSCFLSKSGLMDFI